MLKAGDTFLMESGPSKHLFVVLCDPKIAQGYGKVLVIVCVSITSAMDDGRVIDQSCIIEQGEHPFIKHRSFAFYRKATALTEVEYGQAITSGLYPVKEPVSPELLLRLQHGLRNSISAPRYVKDLL